MPEDVTDTPEVVEEQPELTAVPEAAPETEETPEDGKPQGGFQRRIDKLTREKYELAGQLREMREREQATRSSPPAAPPKPAAEPDPEPKPEQFDTYEKYVKAQARWEAREQFRELTAKQQEDQRKFDLEQHAREVHQMYNEGLASFRGEHDDFNEVVGSIRLHEEVGNAVQNAIMEDPEGPALAYWIGQHPEVAELLDQMSATAAVKYVGRLAERLFPETAASDGADAGQEDEPAPPVARTQRAPSLPAPITPTRRASPTDKGLHDSLSPKDWEARFKKLMGYS